MASTPVTFTIFTNELVLQLIEAYKNQELLWDPENRDYKNKSKKNAAWDTIANAVNISRREVESKMHTLRSQFAREKRKIAQMRESGKDDLKYTPWFAYDAFKFLLRGETETADGFDISDMRMPLTQSEKSKRYREKLKRTNPEKYLDMKKKNISRAIKAYHNKKQSLNDAHKEDMLENSIQPPVNTIQSTSNESANASNCAEELSDSYQIENVHIPMMLESTDTTSNFSNNQSRKRTKSYDERSDGDDTIAYNVFPKQSQQTPRSGPDEFEIFAQYVASELRETGDLYSILVAKNHINGILFNARIGKYRQRSRSSVNKRRRDIKTEYDIINSDVNDED